MTLGAGESGCDCATANLSMSATGSAPGERSMMSGRDGWESPKDFARSKGGGRAKSAPKLAVINARTADNTESGRSTRSRMSRRNSLQFCDQLDGEQHD